MTDSINEQKEKSGEPTIQWTSRAHNGKERGNLFYFAILGLTVLLLVFSVWQKDFLFGVFVILASGTVLFLSSQKPEDYSFKITDDEFVIGENENVYKLSRFNHFDIYEYSPSEIELLLVFKEKFRPVLRIKIHRSDREKISERLAKELPQRKTEPSFLDILSRIIGI